MQLLAKERKEDDKIRFSDFGNDVFLVFLILPDVYYEWYPILFFPRSVEKEAIKGISFCIALGWLLQFPGCPTFINYCVLIFEKSGVSLVDPYLASIILAVAQLVGGIFSTQLADTMGRKLSMILSFLGSAVALLILSVYLYLNEIGYIASASYSWIPVTTLSFIMFASTAGILALYAVCFVEYLPTKVCEKSFKFNLLSNKNGSLP